MESRLQEPPDAAAHFANHARRLLDGRDTPFDWDWREVAAAWRWGFDPTARHLSVFEQLLLRATLLEPPATSGRERDAQWAMLCDEPWIASSSIVHFAVSCECAQERGRRCMLTRVRLLRLALAFHQRAPLPALLDPFTGECMRVEIDGDVAVFRSGAPESIEHRAVRR